MFGTQRDFENRLLEYRSGLAGIKHLHRLKTPSASASRPQPNEPITLRVTTSGGIAYDSVRCWMNINGKETTFELTPAGSVWNTLEWRYVRHWSNKHPTFQAAQGDADSEYRAWYIWQHWPDTYTSFFGVKGMPQLNLKHKPASDYLLASARYWLENGVDGYRLDYAPGPPQTFWADFRQACKAVKPDVFLFGEVVGHAEAIASYIPHFDGCLDFLLADALRRTFVLETSTLLEFEAFLAAHETYFLSDFSLPAFLDNHDMTRILYLAGEDKAKVKLAALVLFTLSAPPVIYNGTEVGVSQRNPLGRFEEARLPMLWGNERDKNLLTYFRQLGALRKQFPAITSGRREVVHLNVQHGTYAYIRTLEDNPILIVLNTSRCSQTINIPISSFPSSVKDLLNGNSVTVSRDSVEVSLPAQSSAFIA